MSSYLIRTEKDLRDALKKILEYKRISHDTETKGPDTSPDISGLYPFHGARSFSHIIATDTDEFYFDFNEGGLNSGYKKDLAPIFKDPERSIFYVNAIFDATISYFDGIEIDARVIDCPSIARVEYNNHGKNIWDEESFLSLEYLANYYEVKQKDDRVKAYIKEHELYSTERCRFTKKIIPLYHKVPLELMFEYGCSDARSTYDLGLAIARSINYKDERYEDDRNGLPPMMAVAQKEIKLTKVLIDMKIRGMKVWEDFVKQAIEYETNIGSKLSNEVNELTGGINFNSGKQIAEYLESKGVEVPMKEPTDNDIKMMDKWLSKADEVKNIIETKNLTSNQKQVKIKHYNQFLEKANNYKKGRPITDKKTLKKLMESYPDLDFLAKITKAKEAEKKLNTYYKNFMLLKDSSNFIHCGLNQEKAKTGRFSSSQPNLQNLEKKYVYDED